MRALSLWEPWATAIRLGWKCNETRDWPTSYRGDVLICAALKKLSIDDIGSETAERMVMEEKLHHGHAVCIVELYDCVPTKNFLICDKAFLPLIAINEREYELGNYTPGRFAFRLRNLRVIEPLPWKGRQGFWTLTDAEVALVNSRIVAL